MLNVFFGDMNDAIYNTNVYFNNTYKNQWITSELAIKIKVLNTGKIVTNIFDLLMEAGELV